MTTKAHAEFDPMGMGVRLAIRRDAGDGRVLLMWQPPTLLFQSFEEMAAVAESGPDGSPWLQLPEDDARAVYEALADYFGHTGNDVRALRRDYDAERKRVDLLLDRTVPRLSS